MTLCMWYVVVVGELTDEHSALGRGEVGRGAKGARGARGSGDLVSGLWLEFGAFLMGGGGGVGVYL